MSEKEIEEEQKSFERVLAAFQQYSLCIKQWLHEKRTMFANLTEESKKRIFFGKLEESETVDAALFKEFQALNDCIEKNQQFLTNLVLPHADLFENVKETHNQLAPAKIKVFQSDVEKVKSTLRQIAREWSDDGQEERNKSFKPLLEALALRFPDLDKRNGVKVLTPGCGLGRLTWEIANLGFSSQGNEFSFHMLLCSFVILNQTEKINQWTIYPWIHSFCNVLKSEHQQRRCQFPDVLPGNLPKNIDFSMSAGDFIEIHADSQENWDAVITCFFIDTAHNVIEYVETINRILKPGGYWINLGPLLYHWADMPGEQSVELNYDQIKNVIASFGMKMEEEKTYECIYTGNYRSMMHLVYSCKFFVVRKPVYTSKNK